MSTRATASATVPGTNANGEMIAQNVADLHGDVQRDRNNLHKGTALSETGEVINGRGDRPNRHDMLTGSNSDGARFRQDLQQLDK